MARRALPRPVTIGLCLLVAVAVVAISVLFYSPLHKHDRNSTQACTFTQFEHGGFEPPAVHIDLPVFQTHWQRPPDEPAKLLCLDYSALCVGRAPPSPLS